MKQLISFIRRFSLVFMFFTTLFLQACRKDYIQPAQSWLPTPSNTRQAFAIDAALTTTNLASAQVVTIWAYFKVEQQGTDVLLNWGIMSEKNTKYLMVERSLDGTEFVQIGAVAPSGNSSQPNNYQYTDNGICASTALVLYYRIKKIDTDAATLYSQVKRVTHYTYDANNR